MVRAKAVAYIVDAKPEVANDVMSSARLLHLYLLMRCICLIRMA